MKVFDNIFEHDPLGYDPFLAWQNGAGRNGGGGGDLSEHDASPKSRAADAAGANIIPAPKASAEVTSAGTVEQSLPVPDGGCPGASRGKRTQSARPSSDSESPVAS